MPMKIPFVDLHAQYLSIKGEIDSAVQDVIAQSAYIRGFHVDSFEEAWAKTVGVKHCVSCANGTDALYVAMRGWVSNRAMRLSPPLTPGFQHLQCAGEA